MAALLRRWPFSVNAGFMHEKVVGIRDVPDEAHVLLPSGRAPVCELRALKPATHSIAKRTSGSE